MLPEEVPGLGPGKNKVYREVLGKPVLTHSIEAFLGPGVVDEIVIVYGEGEKKLLERSALAQLDYDLSKISVKCVSGGERRQDSSRAGVKVSETDYVFVHDGARPNFSSDLIFRLLEAAVECGAAFPGIKPVDTIRINNRGRAGETVDREKLVKVQTPQCFKGKLLLEALDQALEGNRYFTDDAGVVMEYVGVRPSVVNGEKANVKITTGDDERLIEALMES